MERLKLSPQQQRLLSLKYNTHPHAYRSRFAGRIDGALDLSRLQEAINTAVNRHTSLLAQAETGFIPQVVTVDLSTKTLEQQQSAIDRLFDESITAGEDFSSSDGLRTTLAILSKTAHVLLFDSPSWCADDKSFEVLTRDISRAYEAQSDSKVSDPPVVQYSVVAEWLNELMQAEESEPARAFWREQDFSGVAAFMLPAEKRLNLPDSFSVRSVDGRISDALQRNLSSVSSQYKESTSSFLLSCWAIVLSGLSDQSECVLGVNFNGRTDDELRDVVGQLAKDLPVKIMVEHWRRFGELIDQVNGSLTEASDFQDCFSWELTRIVSSKETDPFFLPYGFSYQERLAPFERCGLTYSVLSQQSVYDRFKLKLVCTNVAGVINTEIQYDPRFFDQKDVVSLLDRFLGLVDQLADNPDTIVGNLRILTAQEQAQIVTEFNQTQATGWTSELIHKSFERQARENPDHIAVGTHNGYVSYGELNSRANQLARYLQNRGAVQEMLVAICVDRSIEMIVALLGVLKAGAAYLPLSPTDPESRIAFMLKDSGAALVVTTNQHKLLFAEYAVQQIDLDSDWPQIAQCDGDDLFADDLTDRLAYLIYTSGSTGTPKGVMVTHAGLSNHFHWFASNFPLLTDDVVLFKTAFSFDAAGDEIYGSLLQGACLFLAKPGGQQDSEYLVDVIITEQVTVLQMVPSMLHVLMEEPSMPSAYSLRMAFSGGEALPIGLRDRFFEILGARLVNLYGPTEATINVTSHECTFFESREGEPYAAIGQPLYNTRIHLLNSSMQPVAIGAAGELYLGGMGLARGYNLRPDLTAEKFVPDPFDGRGGTRLYKTGDLGRYRSDGIIEYIQRIDDQVKTRGHRVELGEIENALNECPGIRQAVVLARENGNADKQLVAYLVADRDANASTTEVLKFLRSRLPDYMIPAKFAVIDSLPLFANGKIHRAALAEIRLSDLRSEAPFVEPETETEKEIAAIWRELLGVERVGVNDDFFALGGHSLLLIRLSLRLRRIFHIDLRLTLLFEKSTLREMANVVTDELMETEDSEELAQMLHDLKHLSSEEIQAMIEAED